MSTARRLHYTYTDYLRCLEDSDVKLEYCDGVIYAMAGGTRAHALLSGRMIALLTARLGRCDVHTSDLKVRIEATDLTTYPDVTVTCGDAQTSAIDANAVTNPTLLVEVTSRSTEDFDRGDKLSHYKQLPSLRAVLFVSHRTKRITVVQREGASWSERDFRGSEDVRVLEPEVSFPVDEVYRDVALDE